MTGNGGGATDRARLQSLLHLGLGVGAAWVIALILWPFLPALVTSAILATLMWPLQRRLARRIRHRDVLALSGTLITTLILVVPLGLVSLALINTLHGQVQPVTEGAGRLLSPDGRAAALLEAVGARFGIDPAVFGQAIIAQLQQLGGTLIQRTVAVLTGLGGWLLQAGAALFALYYLLRDGDELMRALRWFSPLDPAQTQRLIDLAHDAIRATVLGNIVVAGVQGLVGGLAFWIIGVPAPAFWGLIMGVLSLLPVVGPAVVWVPAAVLLGIDGRVGAGLLLAAFGTLVISSVDNVLRSILISGRARLHPLAVFFGLLGGVFLFGAVGVLLGPVLFVVALTVLEMSRLALSPEPGGDPVPEGAPVRPWLLVADGVEGKDP